MKKVTAFYSKGLFQVTFAVVVALLLSVAFVQSATTISTNISTGGTLAVTGLSTLSGGATTTTITLLNGEVISNATDGVIQMNGIASSTSITLLNGETITNATDGTITLTGAVTATGLATFSSGATTTTLTLLNGAVISEATDGVVQINATASTTGITLLNGETITNATDGTIAITGALSVSATTSPVSVVIGSSTPTSIGGNVFVLNNTSGTTTAVIATQTANSGGCIQIEAPGAASGWFRLYATSTGYAVWESGTCQ
jgi:hypothetical protein